MKCAGCQGALWLYLGLGVEFQAQLLREQHIVLIQQVRDVAASHLFLLRQDVASLESQKKELEEGKVPLLISSAALEMQTMGPASPQLQLVGVRAHQHPSPKPISYWYSLLRVSLMPDVLI